MSSFDHGDRSRSRVPARYDMQSASKISRRILSFHVRNGFMSISSPQSGFDAHFPPVAREGQYRASLPRFSFFYLGQVAEHEGLIPC